MGWMTDKISFFRPICCIVPYCLIEEFILMQPCRITLLLQKRHIMTTFHNIHILSHKMLKYWSPQCMIHSYFMLIPCHPKIDNLPIITHPLNYWIRFRNATPTQLLALRVLALIWCLLVLMVLHAEFYALWGWDNWSLKLSNTVQYF